MDSGAIWVMAGQMRDILQLSSASIGVSLQVGGSESDLGQRTLAASLLPGVDAWLSMGRPSPSTAAGWRCPAAAAAFGFRPLPEAFTNGSGLVGFGIAQDPAVGQRMFEEMPRLGAKPDPQPTASSRSSATAGKFRTWSS